MLPGLDSARVAELIDAADDEGLFREVLLAQCNELAGLMPRVFGEVGGADALMLPANLLRPDGVVGRLVRDVPLEAWESVEVLGWMYQFYISERKDEVFAGFKKKQKATADTLGPATQLFTPEWIVRYMVENSLGRLWMLNHPESRLRERMEYYIEPEGEVEDFVRVSSPEEITLCDPACGSGHILVYAFDLLYAMYEEAGYRAREIPELILSRNLFGLEIDERAAELAVLALCMKGREHDRRLFSRGAAPDIQLLESVELDEGELERLPNVAARKGLADTLAHLSEVGSLFRPEAEDVEAIEADLATLPEGDLFAVALREKLQCALSQCTALARTYACVVANPPYMGSSNFNAWLGKWVKKHYPDEKSDLCTCFIERAFSLTGERGYSALVTMQSWMYNSSFESFRKYLLSCRHILCQLCMGHMVMPIAFRTCATIFYPKSLGSLAWFFEVNRGDLNEQGVLSPFCFRKDKVRKLLLAKFKALPGAPIAYWATDAVFLAFQRGCSLETMGNLKSGMQTGNNDLFLRYWFEVEHQSTVTSYRSLIDCAEGDGGWILQPKGGPFRKWFGNIEYVLDFRNNGKGLQEFDGSSNLSNRDFFFREGFFWSNTSSGEYSARYMPKGCIFNVEAPSFFPSDVDQKLPLGFCNSSVFSRLFSCINQTMHYTVGDIARVPYFTLSNEQSDFVASLVERCINLSRLDWNSMETSVEFPANRLVMR